MAPDTSRSTASVAPVVAPIDRVRQRNFILGLFLPIQDGGWTPSTAARGTEWSFGYNARLTQLAESFDFDLAFAQWMHGINRGVLLPPGLDEQWLVSVMHSEAEAMRYASVFQEFVDELVA